MTHPKVSPMDITWLEPITRRQTTLARLQVNRQCTKVSCSRSQIGQFGTTRIPMLFNIDLVGTEL